MSAHEITGVTAAEWLDRGLDRPELVVQGIPTSAGGGSGSDAWQAPAALRRLLGQFTTFDSEHGVDLEELRAADWSDWLVSHMDITEAHELITNSTNALPTRPTYVFLGGDHSITHPILTGLPHAPLDRIGLLVFDSRHDVEPDGPGNLANQQHLRQLIEEGLDPQHVVQIGIHGFANSLAARAWCEQRGVRVATRRMIDEHGIARVVDEALAYLAPDVDVIHVSCDFSVLDRTYAPACARSRPGGLTPRALTTALLRCGANEHVVSVDLVEVDPVRDVAQTTAMALAQAFLAFCAGVALRPITPDELDA